MVIPRPKSINLRGRFRRWRDEDSLKDCDLAAELDRLREAMPVNAFGRIVSRIERNHLADKLFERREQKPWQEAWIAWRFAFFDRATHLQLADECADDDFYLKRRGADWAGFQVTEALLEGRQRTKEYRDARYSGRRFKEVDGEEMRRESEGAIPALLRALEKKTLSARGGRLVIYWNTGWLLDRRKFIADLKEKSDPYRSLFAEAWIIGKGSVFKVAPQFKMVSGPPISLGNA